MAHPRSIACLGILRCGVVAAIVLSARSADAQMVTHIPLSSTNDLIYAPGTQRLYASTRPDRITVINPFSGTIEASVVVGTNPNRLAISDDGQFLYIGLDGAVRRVVLSTLTPDILIPLGSDPTFGPLIANDIAVLPGNARAIAVSRPLLGTAIYDDAAQRPVIAPGSGWLEFSSSAARLYGYENNGRLTRMTVDSSGVSVLDVTPALIFGVADIDFEDGVVYASDGTAIDPEAGVLLGRFFEPAPRAESVVADAALGRVFFRRDFSLYAYDRVTRAAVGYIRLPAGVVPRNLVRWGEEGLAVRSSERVTLIRGSLGLSDLTVTAVSDPPAAARAGTALTVTDTVENAGPYASPPAAVKYYLSAESHQRSRRPFGCRVDARNPGPGAGRIEHGQPRILERRSDSAGRILSAGLCRRHSRDPRARGKQLQGLGEPGFGSCQESPSSTCTGI